MCGQGSPVGEVAYVDQRVQIDNGFAILDKPIKHKIAADDKFLSLALRNKFLIVSQ